MTCKYNGYALYGTVLGYELRRVSYQIYSHMNRHTLSNLISNKSYVICTIFVRYMSHERGLQILKIARFILDCVRINLEAPVLPGHEGLARNEATILQSRKGGSSA